MFGGEPSLDQNKHHPSYPAEAQADASYLWLVFRPPSFRLRDMSTPGNLQHTPVCAFTFGRNIPQLHHPSILPSSVSFRSAISSCSVYAGATVTHATTSHALAAKKNSLFIRKVTATRLYDQAETKPEIQRLRQQYPNPWGVASTRDDIASCFLIPKVVVNRLKIFLCYRLNLKTPRIKRPKVNLTL